MREAIYVLVRGASIPFPVKSCSSLLRGTAHSAVIGADQFVGGVCFSFHDAVSPLFIKDNEIYLRFELSKRLEVQSQYLMRIIRTSNINILMLPSQSQCI